MSSAVALW